MNTTPCSEIQRLIWTEGPFAVPPSHLDGCPTCREQSRQAGDLAAALQGLRTRQAPVPLELEASILDALNPTRMDRARGIVSHPKFWRSAAVGAAAAATAVAGLIVARRLARPEATPVNGEPEPVLVA